MDITTKFLDRVTYLNQKLTNGIYIIPNDHTNIDIIQFGNDDQAQEKDRRPSPWIKCHFTSGNTYLFTVEDYIKLIKNSINIGYECDLVKLTKTFLKEYKKKVYAELELSASQKYVIPEVSLQLETIEEEQKIVDYATTQFLNIINILSTASFGCIPPAISQQIIDILSTCYTTTCEPVNPEKSITFKYDGTLLSFNKADNMIVNKEKWISGVLPIMYSGKLCTKKPTTTLDLDSKEFSLTNFEEIKHVELPDEFEIDEQ